MRWSYEMKYRKRVPKKLLQYINKKEIVKTIASENEKAQIERKLSSALAIASSSLSELSKQALIQEELQAFIPIRKQVVKEGMKYSEAAKIYLQQSEVSIREYKSREYFFRELLPALLKYVYEDDPIVENITPQHLNEIAMIIQKLPSRNYVNLKRLSSEDVIKKALAGEFSDMKTLHVDTVNKHIKRIRSLAHYGFRTGLFTMSTAIPTVKHHYSARDERQALQIDEIEKICNATRNQEVKDFIMLVRYTGMRTSEIGKYKLKVIDGIECFDLRDAESLKTKSSFRVIPKHPKLSNAKFTYTLEHLSRQVKILIDANLENTEKKTGYSLRHTFASELIKKGASPDIVAELLGHKHIGMTLSRYAKGFSVQQLYSAICLL